MSAHVFWQSIDVEYGRFSVHGYDVDFPDNAIELVRSTDAERTSQYLSCAQARELAAALNAAVDAVDRLPGAEQVEAS